MFLFFFTTLLTVGGGDVHQRNFTNMTLVSDNVFWRLNWWESRKWGGDAWVGDLVSTWWVEIKLNHILGGFYIHMITFLAFLLHLYALTLRRKKIRNILRWQQRSKDWKITSVRTFLARMKNCCRVAVAAGFKEPKVIPWHYNSENLEIILHSTKIILFCSEFRRPSYHTI